MNYLKEMREKRGMTQQELANKVGVTRPAISMIEIGKNRPSPKLAKAIGEVLKVKRWYKFLDN